MEKKTKTNPFDQLLACSLCRAKQLLDERIVFPPFALASDLKGHLTPITAYDGLHKSTAIDAYLSLRDLINHLLSERQITAGAVTGTMHIPPGSLPNHDAFPQAIAVVLTSAEDARLILLPYKTTAKLPITYADPISFPVPILHRC